MTFARKIRMSRLRANLTQEQLADRIGVTRRTIAAYEGGEAVARSDKIEKLSVALGVSPYYLREASCTKPREGFSRDQEFGQISRKARNRKQSQIVERLSKEPKSVMLPERVLEGNKQVFFDKTLTDAEKTEFLQAILEVYKASVK